MKTLFNIIFIGAIIGFLLTSSDVQINSAISSTINIFSDIVQFIGHGLIKLGKAIS